MLMRCLDDASFHASPCCKSLQRGLARRLASSKHDLHADLHADLQVKLACKSLHDIEHVLFFHTDLHATTNQKTLFAIIKKTAICYSLHTLPACTYDVTPLRPLQADTRNYSLHRVNTTCTNSL